MDQLKKVDIIFLVEEKLCYFSSLSVYSLQSARFSLKGIVIALTFSAICFCCVDLAFFLRSKAAIVPVHSLDDFGWHTEKSSKSPMPLTFSFVKNMKIPRKFPTKFGRGCRCLQRLLHNVSVSCTFSLLHSCI